MFFVVAVAVVVVAPYCLWCDHSIVRSFVSTSSVLSFQIMHICKNLAICTAVLGVSAAAVETRDDSYDYVIVGGGTGGLTIAARLAEDKNVSVAVIEAGGFYQIDNGNGRSVMTNATGASTRILNLPTVSFPVFAAVKA